MSGGSVREGDVYRLLCSSKRTFLQPCRETKLEASGVLNNHHISRNISPVTVHIFSGVWSLGLLVTTMFSVAGKILISLFWTNDKKEMWWSWGGTSKWQLDEPNAEAWQTWHTLSEPYSTLIWQSQTQSSLFLIQYLTALRGTAALLKSYFFQGSLESNHGWKKLKWAESLHIRSKSWTHMTMASKATGSQAWQEDVSRQQFNGC